MTVFPHQISEVSHLYNRLSKLRPSTILKKDETELQETVHISAEAKKRQVLVQARSEVMEQIKKTR